jgi:hypothetical protein
MEKTLYSYTALAGQFYLAWNLYLFWSNDRYSQSTVVLRLRVAVLTIHIGFPAGGGRLDRTSTSRLHAANN